MFNYSTDFMDAAEAMGYDCHDKELPPEVEIAVKNQMRRDAQSLKRLEMNKVDARCLSSEQITSVCNRMQNSQQFDSLEKRDSIDLKKTSGKPDPLLIPYEALVAYSKVSDDGLRVHGSRDTWMNHTPEEGIIIYTAACARHLGKCRTEPIDPASGLPHAYAVLWNAAAAIWHYERLGK